MTDLANKSRVNGAMMSKLLSVSDDEWSLRKFDNDTEKINAFLAQSNLQGLELVRWHQPAGAVPDDKIVGRHMPFWPAWLDFWRSDTSELLRQFGTREDYCRYYDAESIEQFIQDRRAELREAEEIGVRYAVFHVCHVQIEHCYNRRFTYSDGEIVDAYIQMLNTILEGMSPAFTLLFENHWFPGLTFLDVPLAMKLLEKIKAPHKGFVLDVSHMINTNQNIINEPDAVQYILDVLDRFGAAKNHIKAIHLNNSAGAMAKAMAQNIEYRPQDDFENRLLGAMKYVSAMDPHAPFTHPDIRRVIEAVQPEYLVYELAANSLEELRSAVDIQNKSLSG